MLMFMSKML